MKKHTVRAIFLISILVGFTYITSKADTVIVGVNDKSNNNFFSYTTTFNDYSTAWNFRFDSTNIVLSNDSSNIVQYSFDCIHHKNQGRLIANEAITYNNKKTNKICIKSSDGGDRIRIMAW